MATVRFWHTSTAAEPEPDPECTEKSALRSLTVNAELQRRRTHLALLGRDTGLAGDGFAADERLEEEGV
jgi:hypothetical protein